MLEQFTITSGIFLGAALLYLWQSFPVEAFARLKRDSHYQHQLFATAAILSLLFFLRAGIQPGLDLHFVGLTAVTLSLGWRMASLCGAISLLPLLLVGQLPLSMLGIELLLGIFLPVLFSYLVFILVYHYLPKNLFVYIFAAAFAGGALMFILRTLAMAGYYLFSGEYDWAMLTDNYLVMIPLFLVPSHAQRHGHHPDGDLSPPVGRDFQR